MRTHKISNRNLLAKIVEYLNRSEKTYFNRSKGASKKYPKMSGKVS